MVTIGAKQVKHILGPSTFPGLDFTGNPYVGCSHACVYCYARFMQRYAEQRGLWGSYVLAKDWPPLTVAHDAKRFCGKSLQIGTATDPYLAEEETLGKTRQLLTELLAIDQYLRAPQAMQGSLLPEMAEPDKPGHSFNLTLITKGHLVERDLDLLTQFAQARVIFSINTMDESLRQEMDKASPIIKRLTAMKACHEAGVTTTCMIAPIMPGLSDVPSIIHAVRPYCNHIWLDRLNLSISCREPVLHYIATQHPYLMPLYQDIYDHNDESYWYELDRYLRQIATACGMEYCTEERTTAPLRPQDAPTLLVNFSAPQSQSQSQVTAQDPVQDNTPP